MAFDEAYALNLFLNQLFDKCLDYCTQALQQLGYDVQQPITDRVYLPSDTSVTCARALAISCDAFLAKSKQHLPPQEELGLLESACDGIQRARDLLDTVFSESLAVEKTLDVSMYDETLKVVRFGCDQFLNHLNLRRAAVEKQIKRLNDFLFPLLRDRDEVKRKIGEVKWTNNPAPKQDYAERRRQSEEQLKLLEILFRGIHKIQATVFNVRFQ